MTTTYEIRPKHTQAWLEVMYHDGFLIRASVFNPMNLSDLQRDFIWSTLIKYIQEESGMKKYCTMHDGKFRYQTLEQDISFDNFWRTYGNKVGKKERANQLWKLLPDEEKARALAGIKKYKAWLLQNPSVQMLYPETYISQKRWENEY